MSNKKIEITVFVKYQTAGAILVHNLNSVEVWIPKSQIEADGEIKEGKIEIEIPEWLALKNGLI